MEIRLIEPMDGAVTQPLQRYYWSDDEGADPSDSLAPIGWDDLEEVSEDRSHAAPVLFAWEPESDDRSGAIYDLVISEHENMRDPRVLNGLARPRAEVLHLHIGTPYYWKVVAHHDGDAVSESPIWAFTTHRGTPRWITVPGITNVRDMGGWPLPDGRMVKQGMIYRSSEMNNHVIITDEGHDVLVDDLGIRTDLDLRGEGENAGPVLDTSRVEWINIPVYPYGNITQEHQYEPYRKVFEVFADETKYPILFHCWGGADRAGTVAIMLGALLGKSREHLVRDYELTSFSIWGIRTRYSDEFMHLMAALEPYADENNLNKRVENYLLSTGLSKESIARIRELMIADAP